MQQIVPTSKKVLAEAFSLSTEILQNIEKSEMPLADIALKTSRLARLLNDIDYEKVMQLEVSGYPPSPEGMPPDLWRLALLANRGYKQKDYATSEIKQYAYVEPISSFEQTITIATTDLQAAHDPDISIASSNPYQTVTPSPGNAFERIGIRNKLSTATTRLANSRSLIYSYVLRRHTELAFSGISDDIFSRTRSRVDNAIGELIPESVQRFSSAYNNLQSENPEDWSNAVHSCRRILQDLADKLFPAREDKIIQITGGKSKTIKLGQDNYINRLIAFIEEKSSSEKFQSVVGSELAFIGNRLDSIFLASQKGSHSVITSKEEADRYVVYTYLIIGDILSLI